MNGHGGRRPGAGRRPGLTDTEKARKEAEYQKFSYMADICDKTPIYQLSVEAYCQTDKCLNMTDRGLWQMRNRIYSIRPICDKCIKEGEYEDAVE